MKRRLFLSIAIPRRINDAIGREVEKIRYGFTDEVRFIDDAERHITISFLGSQADEAMADISGAMAVARTFPAPTVSFDMITYGPRRGEPRMIWLNGDLETDKTLHELKEEVENRLIDGGISFQREYKRFQTHVTLAKMKTHEALPELSVPFRHSFVPESLDLMESHMSRTGATYELLQKMPFQVS
ncbi:MAG: RNA 2',3'-cyclic phosphodiesterase [Patescibacteria group bacterium]|nr:RNA 2',3'-cyclic phosphodiesterase [Patescibacteria group bacterium]